MTGKNGSTTGPDPVTGAGLGSGSGTSSEPGGGMGSPATPGPATVSGDIRSLNAVDGLFLRAEHLRTMQSYARDLSLAVGIGSGTGVVYGFDVSLDKDDDNKDILVVQPGLGMGPTGQPLRSTSEAVVSLAPADVPDFDDTEVWVIEVRHAWWNSGNENVYGNLCDEPCSGSGSVLQPWTVEGITVSLRPDASLRLTGVDPDLRRNRLASLYFERERSESWLNDGGPWLFPRTGQNGQVTSVGSIKNHDWRRAIGPPDPSGMPIGILHRVDDAWLLDTWTARREIGDPPADNKWRVRLAMRPWNVFLAQVLQFQDQLGSTATMAPKAGTTDKHEAVKALSEAIKSFVSRVGHTPTARTKAFKELVSRQQEAETAQGVVTEGPPLLIQRGFDELPPAGFLAREDTGASLDEWLESLFGTEKVDLRICHVRADQILVAVQQAQHRDRIPLNSQFGRVDVDVLVPDVLADLKGTYTESYPWVAFVRRREAPCVDAPPAPEPPDEVGIYTLRGDAGDLSGAIEDIEEGNQPGGAKFAGTLEYPTARWEYPETKMTQDITAQPGMTLIAVASNDMRRPLAALRASLFAASFDEGIAPPPVRSVVGGSLSERIIVFTTTPTPPERIDVFRFVGTWQDARNAYTAATIPDTLKRVGTLQYPADSWEYPGTLALGLPAPSGTQMLAVASTQARRPLAALRASLFAASLDEGITFPPVRSVMMAEKPEAIIAVLPPPPPQPPAA